MTAENRPRVGLTKGLYYGGLLTTALAVGIGVKAWNEKEEYQSQYNQAKTAYLAENQTVTDEKARAAQDKLTECAKITCPPDTVAQAYSVVYLHNKEMQQAKTYASKQAKDNYSQWGTACSILLYAGIGAIAAARSQRPIKPRDRRIRY